jgi:hypothetical protein
MKPKGFMALFVYEQTFDPEKQICQKGFFFVDLDICRVQRKDI